MPDAVPPSAGPPTVSFAEFYNLVMAERGFGLAAHHFPLCAALEDARIHSLLVVGPQGLGKSSLLSVAYPTFRLGKDPSTTILGVSAGEKLIQTFVNAAAQVIQHSKPFRQLFPSVRPDVAQGWSMERGLFVTGHLTGDQDASFFLSGLKSKALAGVHAREIICDDIHDDENSATVEQRSEVRDRFYRTVMGRADPRGCRFVVVGRRWARDDLYGELAREGGWTYMRIPAKRPPGEPLLWWDVTVPAGETNVFTETLPVHSTDPATGARSYRAYYGRNAAGDGFYWPASRQKRRDALRIERATPRIFAIAYQGDEAAGEGGLFERSDFRPYVPPENLALGMAVPEVAAFVRAVPGAKVGDAWDTAAGKATSAALTAALCGVAVPCSEWHGGEDPAVVGKCDFHYDLYLLDLLKGNIDFGQLVAAFRDRYAKWHADRVIVEDQASGISLIQVTRGMGIPLRAQKVAEGKIERAVNGVGGGPWSVQGWAKMGRVRVPVSAPWLESFLDVVLKFSGDQTGRADEFDVLVHLCTWAITLSSKTVRLPSGGSVTGQPDGGTHGSVYAEGRQKVLDGFSVLVGLQPQNPFTGLCGAPCAHYGVENNAEWCGLHKRRTSGIGGCDRWEAKGG